MNYLKINYLKKLKLVRYSPWPFICSLISFCLTGGLILWWRKKIIVFPIFSFISLYFLMYFWWRDVKFEKVQGIHSSDVLKFFRLGMILFITSEVLFFFSFFWAYFHFCLISVVDIGGRWPPFNFYSILIDPFSIPLLKTVLLLSSGVTITRRHHFIIKKKFFYGYSFLILTIFLGVFFLLLQLFEYSSSLLRVKSSSYGSCFFLLTGFHGLHVFVGAVLLLRRFFRLLLQKYTPGVHLVFELRAWYWHFVDVVWLFLYFFVYWFGFQLIGC